MTRTGEAINTSEVDRVLAILWDKGGQRTGTIENLLKILRVDFPVRDFESAFRSLITRSNDGRLTITHPEFQAPLEVDQNTSSLKLCPYRFAEAALNFLIGEAEGVVPFQGQIGKVTEVQGALATSVDTSIGGLHFPREVDNLTIYTVDPRKLVYRAAEGHFTINGQDLAC